MMFFPQECSVFLFEKRCAEKLHKPRRKETVTELLRASVKQLERFRHPKVKQESHTHHTLLEGMSLRLYVFQILQIIHTVEECPDTLAFATEPVLASLANILAFYVSQSSFSPNRLVSNFWLIMNNNFEGCNSSNTNNGRLAGKSTPDPPETGSCHRIQLSGYWIEIRNFTGKSLGETFHFLIVMWGGGGRAGDVLNAFQ